MRDPTAEHSPASNFFTADFFAAHSTEANLFAIQAKLAFEPVQRARCSSPIDAAT